MVLFGNWNIEMPPSEPGERFVRVEYDPQIGIPTAIVFLDDQLKVVRTVRDPKILRPAETHPRGRITDESGRPLLRNILRYYENRPDLHSVGTWTDTERLIALDLQKLRAAVLGDEPDRALLASDPWLRCVECKQGWHRDGNPNHLPGCRIAAVLAESRFG